MNLCASASLRFKNLLIPFGDITVNIPLQFAVANSGDDKVVRLNVFKTLQPPTIPHRAVFQCRYHIIRRWY